MAETGRDGRKPGAMNCRHRQPQWESTSPKVSVPVLCRVVVSGRLTPARSITSFSAYVAERSLVRPASSIAHNVNRYVVTSMELVPARGLPCPVSSLTLLHKPAGSFDLSETT